MVWKSRPHERLPNELTHTKTTVPLPTQQRGQRPHVLLHQGVDLLLGEAPDAVAVHLSAHHAAVQVAQQPLQRVAQRAAHRKKLLGFLQVVHPLTVSYRPEKHTKVQWLTDSEHREALTTSHAE